MTRLYHYTCDHGLAGIQRTGVLRPGPSGLVWLTDMRTPNRNALGLTSTVLSCDRLAHRILVDVDDQVVTPWMTARRRLPGPYVLDLESAPDAKPQHWWVASEPINVATRR